MKIGFDLMGSDKAPQNELEALRLLKDDPIADILVCGKTDHEKEVLTLGFEFVLANEVIGMHEIPSVAIRHKANSSMGILMHLLKNGEIDAVVSAGNTGALFGFSMVTLGKLEGLSRAGLAITLPVETGYSVLLDVGSNIYPKVVDYHNYGKMGAILAGIINGKKDPRIGMLNVGSESMKGDDTRKRAYQLLMESDLNFIGNIEGNDIMKGFADTIITDGFTGNVIIKFSEGMVDSLWRMLQEEVDAVARQRVGQFLVKPAIKELRAKFNYEEYGGGILLGVDGIVIICHGHSSPHALKNAIRFSKTCIEYNIVSMIREKTA